MRRLAAGLSNNLHRFRNSTLHTISLHNSLSNSPVLISSTSHFPTSPSPSPFNSIWYTCGPTVYDSTHLGHAFTYVTLDFYRRAILSNHKATPSGFLFVLNITDIDDKIIDRASSQNIPPKQLARHYESEFFSDMDYLNVKRPDVVVRVTDHVDEIISYVSQILSNGYAYVDPPSGSVYFDTQSFESKGLNKYGKMAPPTSSVDFKPKHFDSPKSPLPPPPPSPKKDPRDFALWKGCPPDTSPDISFPSPWGVGRPGWHVECSAMIDYVSKITNSQPSVHAGGIDLKFPHHTNEIAQAEAYHDFPSSDPSSSQWMNNWIHTGHLHINGAKMSKSLKNFVTIPQFRSMLQSSPKTGGDVFRWWALGMTGSHGSNAVWSEESMKEASSIHAKLVQFLLMARSYTNDKKSSKWTPSELGMRKHIEKFLTSKEQVLTGGRLLEASILTKQILILVSEAKSYMEKNEGAPEVIRNTVVDEIGDLLDLMGFTSYTSRPYNHEGGSGSGSGRDGVQVAKLFREFRENVRKSALQKDLNKGELLSLCDSVRDDPTLSRLGVFKADVKVV
ncbi:hypothetical protein ScalyP_jg9129 [Parmales sp. scaly parma]|nr:hypothetical protein ScalyP_jg9129 [Parmales sp. scaly parma]